MSTFWKLGLCLRPHLPTFHFPLFGRFSGALSAPYEMTETYIPRSQSPGAASSHAGIPPPSYEAATQDPVQYDASTHRSPSAYNGSPRTRRTRRPREPSHDQPLSEEHAHRTLLAQPSTSDVLAADRIEHTSSSAPSPIMQREPAHRSATPTSTESSFTSSQDRSYVAQHTRPAPLTEHQCCNTPAEESADSFSSCGSRRLTPAHTPTTSQLEPFYIRSASIRPVTKQLLAEGFESEFPKRLMAPRDVSFADWTSFTQAMTSAGKLTGMQKVKIGAGITFEACLCGVTGFLGTIAYGNRMRDRKEPLICDVVEQWQQSFFVPRKLDVYILYDGRRLTARYPNGPIPFSSHDLPRGQSQRSVASSSCSSTEFSADCSRHMHCRQVRDKCERNCLKRELKASRKHLKAEHKHQRKMAKLERKYGYRQNETDLGWNYHCHQRLCMQSRQCHCCRMESPDLTIDTTQGYFLVIAPLASSFKYQS